MSNELSQGIATTGTCLAVSAGCPATHDEPGFVAMDWSTTTIEVENYGEFGGTTNVIKWPSACTGDISKRPGSTDHGTQVLSITHVIDDPAQVLFKTHFKSREPVSIRLTYVNGDIDYLTGYVTARPKKIGGDGDHVTMSITLEINGEPIEVPAP